MNFEYEVATYQSKEQDVSIKIRNIIPMKDMLTLINNVATLVFNNDEYMPGLYDYLWWNNVLAFYTDFNTQIEADSLLEEIYCTNLVGTLYAHVNQGQLEAIEKAIQERISLRNNKSDIDKLAHDIRMLLSKYEKVIEKAMTPKLVKSFLEKTMSSIPGEGAKDVKQ